MTTPTPNPDHLNPEVELTSDKTVIAEINSLSAEEEILQKQIDAIRKLKQEKEEIKRKIELAAIPVVIKDVKIINDKAYFRSEYREDFVQFLRTLFYRQFDGKYNIIPMQYWIQFEDEAKKIPNVFFHYSPDSKTQLDNWKPEPDYTITYDEIQGFIVKPGSVAPTYELSMLPTSESFTREGRTHYRILASEGWRLSDLLNQDYFNVKRVQVWSDEAKKVVLDQIERRAKLDIIAKKEISDISIDLNGHELKPFQKIGVEFIAEGDFNGIIGDEMGLGKTPQAIALMKMMMSAKSALSANTVSKFLIIVPASLRPNWSRELKKFTGLSSYELVGSSPEPATMARLLLDNTWTFALCNYDMLGANVKEKTITEDANGFKHSKDTTRYPWIEFLNLVPFDAIIIDEGHRIKNVDSNRSQAVRMLNCKHKIVLTGTPLVNRPDELWPLLNFLNPHTSGGYETFMRRYTIDKRTPKNVDELREILRPIMIRRTKKDVLKELAPINRIEKFFSLTPEGQKKYKLVEAGLYAALDSWTGNPNDANVIPNLLVQIMRMKQVCAWDSVELVCDLAVEMYDNNATDWKKGIIFSQFINDPPVIAEITKRLGHEALSITGNQTPLERQEIVDEFQRNPDKHFLVASTLAASEGLNITAAGFVIFNDLMWTPKDHHQAEGRAYGRLSDPHTIDSVYIAYENTICEDILELLSAKMAVFSQVIDGTEASRDQNVAMELLKRIKERRFQ